MAFAYRSWVEISLPRIAANYQAIRQVVGPAVEVMPVVKADAYRHGAVEVSRTLAREGAKWLAVSNVEEGAILRDAGITTRILVMADFLPIERQYLIDYNLTPVIHSLADVREWDRLAGALGVRAAYHLKVDSGMGRLGIRLDTRSEAEEIFRVVREAQNVDLEGLMTHFASSADYLSSQTNDQIQAFETLQQAAACHGIEPKYRHLSSSTPLAYGRKQAWGNMVRPGHAIYGYLSPVTKGLAPPRILEVKPALVWKTQILSVKDIPAGALVGYGGMFRVAQPTRIAILAAGYADGIPHRLSNRGKVIAGGKLAPILGAVSMDLTTIDISATPQLGVGDPVTLLGMEGNVSLDAQQMARIAGTISYSILCGISARVKRIYV